MESQPQSAPKPMLTKDLHNIAKTNLSVAREESDQSYHIDNVPKQQHKNALLKLFLFTDGG